MYADRRLRVLFTVAMTLVVLAGVRSVWFAFAKADTLSSRAQTQQTFGKDILAPRGQISDRNDVALAVSEPASDVSVSSKQVLELRTLDPLLSRSAHGIEFQGDTAARGAAALLAVRDADPGMERLVRVLDVLRVLAAGPASEQKPVVRGWLPALGGADSELISRAIDYILDNLTTGASLHEAARQAAMSDSAFSRYFKAGSGRTFTDMVRQLRLTQACRLLERTDDTVGAIAGAVGYSNLSNFNRQFLRAYGVTPRQHRTSARA